VYALFHEIASEIPTRTSEDEEEEEEEAEVEERGENNTIRVRGIVTQLLSGTFIASRAVVQPR
jgi:hypothetical protein